MHHCAWGDCALGFDAGTQGEVVRVCPECASVPGELAQVPITGAHDLCVCVCCVCVCVRVRKNAYVYVLMSFFLCPCKHVRTVKTTTR
jgi:hypothetical protein